MSCIKYVVYTIFLHNELRENELQWSTQRREMRRGVGSLTDLFRICIENSLHFDRSPPQPIFYSFFIAIEIHFSSAHAAQFINLSTINVSFKP